MRAQSTWTSLAAPSEPMVDPMARAHSFSLTAFGIVAGLMSGPLAADVGCSFSIRVLDGTTREEKVFRPHDSPFFIPLSGDSGWDRCRVSHVKRFKTDDWRKGAPKIDAKRVDLWCYSDDNQVVNASLVVTEREPVGVVIISLMRGPLVFGGTAEDTSVSATGDTFKEIQIFCGSP